MKLKKFLEKNPEKMQSLQEQFIELFNAIGIDGTEKEKNQKSAFLNHIIPQNFNNNK